jgi:iron complex transport system ATP-binding protein
LLDLPAACRETMTSDPLMTKAAAENGELFALEAVAFSVAGRALLAPLSLALPASRVVGLIGHNGSGKSTLVKLLARQHSASAGVIRYEGVPLRDWSDRGFARKVAYLPQQTPAAAGLLVRELVALGRYPWHGALGRFGEADRAKVAEAMALTGVAPFADRMVDTLSGGERQRAWLAMLVAQDARCLLLDEPISALDIAHQIEILALMRRLADERGLGIVVVLHDVNMAARFCDEIIALHGGRLIARGSPDDIMTAQTLQAIYGIPMTVISDRDAARLMCFPS